MNKTLTYLRGDLRIASFALVLAALAGSSARLGGAAVAEMYTVRVAVGPSGFEPRRVAVPLGTVHFVVTSKEGDHCFAIPSLDVEKRVRPAHPLEVDATFERTGEFPFLCCVESPGSTETGVIVVTPAK